MSCQVSSWHISWNMSSHMSCHVICHVMSYVMSCHMSCHVICHVMLYVMKCHMSCNFIYQVMSYAFCHVILVGLRLPVTCIGWYILEIDLYYSMITSTNLVLNIAWSWYWILHDISCMHKVGKEHNAQYYTNYFDCH